jgi:transposase
MLLTHRKLLQSKAIAIENDLRGTLRNFGLKVGMVGKVRFEARIQKLVENIPDLAVLVEPLLIVRRVLREQIVILHRRLLAIVREDGPAVQLTARPPKRLFRPVLESHDGRAQVPIPKRSTSPRATSTPH